MKVLLTTGPFHPHQSYNLKFPRFPVLNLSLMAACLGKAHQVRVLVNAARRHLARGIEETAAAFQPDIIGFSLCSPVSALLVGETIGRLRTICPDAGIVLGGPFPTALPEYCLKEMGADAVFLYEADHSFPAWVERGGRWDGENGIGEGMARLSDDGSGLVRGPESWVKDLDALPMPSWELLDFRPSLYLGLKSAAIEMSRGCPFGCTFCTVHEFGRTYRMKSPERVLEEMRVLWEMGVRELLFVDNSFALNAQKTATLAEGILSAGWEFQFGTYMRADTVADHPELMGKLARAGMRYTIVGFENYSDSSLSAMEKATGLEANTRAARVLRQARIFSVGSHIYGSPQETAADCCRTYISGVANCDLYKAGIFMPLPGSPLYARLKSDGALSNADPLAMDYMRYRVGSFRRRWSVQILSVLLFLRYYLGPTRVLRLLSRDLWTRTMFAAEYRTIVLRVCLVVRLVGCSLFRLKWKKPKNGTVD